MIITRKHADLMEKLGSKWSEGIPLDRLLDKLSDEDMEYLGHLELAGLATEVDGRFELTRAGHLIGEAIKEYQDKEGDLDRWADSFKFIGSEVISMIEMARAAQGDISRQPSISKELELRGLADGGRLTPLAESILEAYDIALPKISITPALAGKLRKCPPGPGSKVLLPFNKEEIFELEAMRLLTFSIPTGGSFSLTGPGQQIRAGLLKGASPNTGITDEILAALLTDNPPDNIRERLAAIGAMDAEGTLLPAGKQLRAAARLLYVEPIVVNPAVDIDEHEFKVLETVDALWGKNQEEHETLPSLGQIREQFPHDPGTMDRVTGALHVLEGFRLVQQGIGEGAVAVYEITDRGKAVLTARRKSGFRAIGAQAVMAITTTRMENLSPDTSWIDLAERQGLIGNGFPTKAGRLFAMLSSTIKRLPVIDSMQRKVLDCIPFWRGTFKDEILSRFPAAQERDVLAALGKLTGFGILDLLPGDLYRLTEPGDKFKRAVSVVPEGIRFHVTPGMIKVLRAAEQSIETTRINWKQTERNSGVDTETFEKIVLELRSLLYIKSDKITTAGKLLLEGVEMLEELTTEWQEIEF